jgi:hypothetical protein
MKVYFVIISKIVLKTGRGISLLGKEKKNPTLTSFFYILAGLGYLRY